MFWKRYFIERFHELPHHSMQSYWNMHASATVYDLALHATSLRALQKGADVYSEKIPIIDANRKGVDRPRYSKHWRGRWKISASSVTVVIHSRAKVHQQPQRRKKQKRQPTSQPDWVRSCNRKRQRRASADPLRPSSIRPTTFEFVSSSLAVRLLYLFILSNLRQQFITQLEKNLITRPQKHDRRYKSRPLDVRKKDEKKFDRLCKNRARHKTAAEDSGKEKKEKLTTT